MSLTNLLARIKATAGPDRELDEAIGLQIAGLKRTIRIGHEALGNERDVPVHCPKYTSSLDETLALVERVLPDARVLMGLRQTPDTLPWARVGKWLVMDGADATGATLPLALISALLCALIAQPASGDVGSANPEEN